MVLFDTILLILNSVLFTLNLINFIIGGYSDLSVYDIIIARAWGFLAVIALFYSLMTFRAKRSTKVLNLMNLIYSVLTLILLFLVFLFGL